MVGHMFGCLFLSLGTAPELHSMGDTYTCLMGTSVPHVPSSSHLVIFSAYALVEVKVITKLLFVISVIFGVRKTSVVS